MKLVTDRASLCLIFILITCCNMFFGWQTSISIRSRIGIMKRMLTVSDPPEEYEWGTSFIGQGNQLTFTHLSPTQTLDCLHRNNITVSLLLTLSI